MQRTARCACGRVAIVVSGDPARVVVCHCDYCQKRTGSVFQVAAWYRHADIIAMTGETTVFSDSPGSMGTEFHFCPRCGTTIYWSFENVQGMPQLAGFTGIAVGCFADPEFPAPNLSVNNRYRHHWIPPLDDDMSHEGFSPLE